MVKIGELGTTWLRRADEFVFGPGDVPLRRTNGRDGCFARAGQRAAANDPHLPTLLSPHDLRHTAASLAVSAGANVKAVQRMLGHESAAMTLDTYSDLFEDDLDIVSDALERALQLAAGPGRSIYWAGTRSSLRARSVASDESACASNEPGMTRLIGAGSAEMWARGRFRAMRRPRDP